MSFIRDTLNVKIFWIVVLIAVSMVSLLVVFNRNFEDINTRYQEKVSELNSTFQNLTGTQTQLNKTLSELELKDIKEADLKKKYTELKNERDSLESQVNKLTLDLVDRDKKINSLRLEVDSLKENVDKLNSKISKLDKRVKCFESGGTNC